MSPPVPQVSTSSPFGAAIFVTLRRIARANPVISSTVSPLRRSPVRNAEICAGVASPSMIRRIISSASFCERLLPEITWSIPSLTRIPDSSPVMKL